MAITTRTVVHVDGISHTFGGALALGPLTFAVHPSEIVAVVGPSGCGKTTLLRIIAGLLEPTSGAVIHSDRRPGSVGFVFQEPALLAWRRVADNARLFVTRRDEPIVERLLRVSGLADHAAKWPHQLSGGMKMRLALVRSLAASPDLLLMDEPFGALDQITRHRLHDELLSLHADQRFGAVLVTHAIDEAVYLADRILVMSGAPGRIVEEFAVPFAGRRTNELRYSPPFAELCGTIAASLGRHA